MRRTFILALFALAGCAPEKPVLQVATPATVSYCWVDSRPQVVADAAQKYCAAKGRNASLRGERHCRWSDRFDMSEYVFECVQS